MRRPGIVRVLVLIAVATAACVAGGGALRAGAAAGPTWWKVDLHEHSAFSGDARADIVLDAALAKQQNYNAVFVTDHDRLSGFQVGGGNGNYLSFTDDLSTRWTSKTSGTGATTPATVSSPVHSGTASLHVAATASTAAQVRSFVYNVRGMGLRSGDVTLDFWAYPSTISGTSGMDVSVSLGGDATTGRSVFGYTTSDNQPQIGKSTVLVWQLGPARAGGSGVYTNTLPYTTGTWNHYLIDVTTGALQWNGVAQPTTTGIDGLPTADQPASYDVLADVMMQAAASNGTADGYFDDFTLQVAQPQCPAAEFVYRDSLFSSLGLSSGTNASGQPFAMFPGREMGQNNHANQFNFDITSASQFSDTYKDPGVPNQDDGALCASSNQPNPQWQFSYYGTDNIPAVQATGYPAQDNHPGVTDSVQDVVNSNAYGADAVEARTGFDYSDPTNLSADGWDPILQKNVVIMGTQGSDAHEGPTTATPSMYIDAPSLTLNDLMHSYFEGRMYGAPGNFPGRIVFNLDGSSSPYPARYPVYVPSTQTSANVNLSITDGVTGTRKVRWIYSNAGGPVQISDTAAGIGSYSSGQYSIPLSGAYTYVRAAVVDPSASVLTIANTEPIFFESVANMPAGMSVRVDSITPPSGTCSCTVAMTKGLTSVTYGGSALSLTLTNPASSVSELRIATAQAPTGVSVDTSPVSAAGSLSAYQSGTSSAWYYDSANDLLYLRDAQATGTSQVSVRFGSSSDTTKPTVPQNLAATAAGSSEVDLTWSASTDSGGSGLAGYRIYRNGGSTPVATVGAGATSFADTGLSASTAYSYRVSAFDNAGNESAQSTAAQATTAAASGGGGGGGGGGSGGGGSGGGGSTGSPPPPSPPVPAPPSPAPPAPTPIDCTLAGKAPSSWVRRQVVLTVQTNAAAGNRAEAIVHSGKVVAAGVVASSRVRLSVDTRRMPNGYSKVVAFVYSDGARACMVRSGLKVDNRAPSLLVVRVVPRGSRNVLLVRPSEAVRVTLTSASRTVASLRIGSRRQVALRLPAVRGTGTLTLVDRAGNRVSRRVSWR